MTTKRIYGYADPLSVRAGEQVSFMISGEGMETVDAQLVRLSHGDENPKGPGFVEAEIASGIPAVLNVRRQFTQIGAFAAVGDPAQRLALSGDFTLYAFICPTKPGGARQAILAKWDIIAGKGYGLGINTDGRLEFWVGDGEEIDQVKRRSAAATTAWYFVAASFNPRRRARRGSIRSALSIAIIRCSVRSFPLDYDSRVVETLRVAPGRPGPGLPFLWAGASEENDRARPLRRHALFRQDRPRRHRRTGAARARRSTELGARRLRAGGKPARALGHHGRLYRHRDRRHDRRYRPARPSCRGINRPVRGMTGWNWAGRSDSFRLDAEAIWRDRLSRRRADRLPLASDLTFTVPEDLQERGLCRCGCAPGETEDHIPFFVRAAAESARSRS